MWALPFASFTDGSNFDKIESLDVDTSFDNWDSLSKEILDGLSASGDMIIF